MEKQLSWNTKMKLRACERLDYLKDFADKSSKILESHGFHPNHCPDCLFDRYLKEGIYAPYWVNRPQEMLRHCMPWGREKWASNKQKLRKGRHLLSYTKTGGGRRIVRGFVRSYTESEIKAYETAGNRSCPVEAVWLPSVMAGYPAHPAYPFVLAHDKDNPDHSKGLAAVLALIDAGLVSRESAETRYWFEDRRSIRSDWDCRYPRIGEVL